MGTHRILNRTSASIPRIQSVLEFFVTEVPICQYSSHNFQFLLRNEEDSLQGRRVATTLIPPHTIHVTQSSLHALLHKHNIPFMIYVLSKY
jgi:hypothetical protein